MHTLGIIGILLWTVIGTFLVAVSFGSKGNESQFYEKLRFEKHHDDEIRSKYWYVIYYLMYVYLHIGTDTEVSSSSLRKLWKNSCSIVVCVILGSIWPLHILFVKLWG